MCGVNGGEGRRGKVARNAQSGERNGFGVGIWRSSSNGGEKNQWQWKMVRIGTRGVLVA